MLNPYEKSLDLNHYKIPRAHFSAIVISLLKICADKKDAYKGNKLHAEIIKRGLLEKDICIGSALISMYAKCGLLEEAHEVFDKLPVRDVVSWNVLISGYTQHDQCIDALNCFHLMKQDGIEPNAITFVCILKACANKGMQDIGKVIHDEIVSKGFLQDNIIVGNSVIDMYARLGLLQKAQTLFDELQVRNTVSWNVIITGYLQHRHGEKALLCFEELRYEGICPDEVSMISALKACGMIRALHKGEVVHAEVIKRGLLERDLVIGNALIDMYTKCDDRMNAKKIFDMMPVKVVASWNSLISGCIQHGYSQQAIDYFEQMQYEGLLPNMVTFACIFQACGNVDNVGKGKEAHARILKQGFSLKDVLMATTLVDMYARCGALTQALKVFDNISSRNEVTWNTMIAGYVQLGYCREALHCLERMQSEGISPDSFTFSLIMKACGNIGAIAKGYETHTKIFVAGFLEKHNMLQNALIGMYVKCGALNKAQEIFNDMSVQNIVSWNILIFGYAHNRQSSLALKYFQVMQNAGFSPNAVTFSCILQVCSDSGLIETGQEIHAHILKMGLLEENDYVGSSLVDMYVNCGYLTTAQEVHTKLPIQNVVSWTALIAGFNRHELSDEAIRCFQQMEYAGVLPNSVTFLCILKGCSTLGVLGKGENFHAEIVRKGLLEKEPSVEIALVDMYAKCGAVAKAQEVFDNMTVCNLASWNALLAGYALVGNDSSVFNIVSKIIGDGGKPDMITFTNVLNVCSHSGLVDILPTCFGRMYIEHGIIPTLEHCICLIDLYGRAGQLDMAAVIINKMPFSLCLTVWQTFMASCKKWGCVILGRSAFEHAEQLDQSDSAVYVCMANIYAANVGLT